MAWNRIALCANDLLGILLMIRLIRLRLHRVYTVFALFVGFDLAASSAFGFITATAWGGDYRRFYVPVEIVTWLLTFWMVYALLDAVLANLPGILRFSRYVLNTAFVITFLAAGAVAKSQFAYAHVTTDWSIRSWVLGIFILQPFIATVALVVIVAILSFVVWFPVELPRNLVLFGAAFVCYFSAETAVVLLREVLSKEALLNLSTADLAVLCGCFLFLIVKLSREGEQQKLRMGHGWEKREQAKLISQLENMNEALIRGAGRL